MTRVMRGRLIRRLVSAQEEERRRVVRELHDGLGQYLVALNLGLASTSRYTGIPDDLAADISRLRALVASIDEEVHRLALDLRPPALDDLGLEEALRRHVDAWSADSGIAADLHTRGLDHRLPDAIETTVFRVVQEALTNVRKHACATRAGVVVEHRDGDLAAIVEDDGCGFPAIRGGPRTSARQTLGLTTMSERAALVGGRLQVESRAGRGTTVYLRIPVDG